MTQVVQLNCPGCKQALRVPADWVNQPMRCKHCGLTFQAKSRPPAPAKPAAKAPSPAKAAAPAPRQATPPPPPVAKAPPAVVVAPPVPVPPSNGSGFGNLDFDSGPAKTSPRRRRKSGGGWVGLVVAVGLMIGVGVVAAVAGPYLVKLATNPPSTGTGGTQVAGTNPDGGNAGQTGQGTHLQGTNPIPPIGGTKASGLFPRRALVISVNNYVYLNPVNYGSPASNGRNMFKLCEQLNRGLRVPMTQVTHLSDAAPREAKPPLKPVIEKAMTEFLETSRAQDRIIVMFVGHAIEMEDEVFLAPVEGERDKKESLIPLKWVFDQMAACKARQKVLILDVNRFNPLRGMERPGSGPMEVAEGKTEGTMGPKLDAMLQEPPAGVQVWSACVADQFSIEYDDGNLHNGAFVDSLIEVLGKGIEGTIQKEDDLMPLEMIVEKVNANVKGKLSDIRAKYKQTSRLTGKCPDDGAVFDPKELDPPRLEVKLPVTAGGNSSQKLINEVLQEVEVPPLKISKQETRIRAEALPPFSVKVMADYLVDDGKSAFRDAVRKAQKVLIESVTGTGDNESVTIRENVPMPSEEASKELLKYQDKLATLYAKLSEALDDLKAAGKDGRDNEASKRWKANYDYILARLEYQIAYLLEYQTLLGDFRRGVLPETDSKIHNGFRISAIQSPKGDSQGKKLVAEAKGIFKKMETEYAGTPWEVLAKRDRVTAMGLEWQPTKIGE